MNELLHGLPVSIDTIILSMVVAVVGWLLKEVATGLIKALIDTMAEVRSFRNDIQDMKALLSLFPKMQQDLNEYYKRLKATEDKLSNHQQ